MRHSLTVALLLAAACNRSDSRPPAQTMSKASMAPAPAETMAARDMKMTPAPDMAAPDMKMAPAESMAAPAESMAAPGESMAAPKKHKVAKAATYTKPSDDELRQKLTAMQYKVTQQDGTEPAFHNEYWDNHADGIYVDIVTGEPLFSSKDKFDSGTGWPSFTRPIESGRVVEREDGTHGMSRTEVHSAAGASHLGHVFDDGPEPTGLRYCIDSAALRFIPASDLKAEGYAAYAKLFAMAEPEAPKEEVAILAGGCFWGMEHVLLDAPGILSIDVGYAGGASKDVGYEDVSGGDTGHAESVRVVFDPSKLSYRDLLLHWYFRGHDPTQLDRQNNDIGSQYRSEIFTMSNAQAQTAKQVLALVDESGKWSKPVVTKIEPASTWVRAEEYHQDYLVKHPHGYNDHYLRKFDF